MSKDECCKEKKNCCGKGWKCVGLVVLGVVGFVLIAAALGLAIMLLWNWLMPSILSLPTIDYAQAIGLAVLSRLLFGGFGCGMKHFGCKSHKHKHHCQCKTDGDKDCCSGDKHKGDDCCHGDEKMNH